jgi:peptidoglycan-N-acetylmuramic acid deacetylase
MDINKTYFFKTKIKNIVIISFIILELSFFLLVLNGSVLNNSNEKYTSKAITKAPAKVLTQDSAVDKTKNISINNLSAPKKPTPPDKVTNSKTSDTSSYNLSEYPDYITDMIRKSQAATATGQNVIAKVTIPPKNNNESEPFDDKIKVTYLVSKFGKTNPDICLTFDDGYDKKSIETTLAVLKKANIKCTFFIIGNCLRLYPDLWKQAVSDGHLICNHTEDHRWLTTLTDDQIKSEITGWEVSAGKVLGDDYVTNMKKEFPLIRIPGNEGSTSKRILKIIGDLGYKPYGWSVETYYDILRLHNLKTEPLGPIEDLIVKHIVTGTGNGDIILLHFNPYDTTKLDAIVSGLINRKFNFKLISDFLEKR